MACFLSALVGVLIGIFISSIEDPTKTKHNANDPSSNNG